MKIYREDRDDQEEGCQTRKAVFCPAQPGQDMKVDQVHPEQHFTQPHRDIQDASLVKQMEELGIGRPSTYASIMQVIEKRGYVLKDGKRFILNIAAGLSHPFLKISSAAMWNMTLPQRWNRALMRCLTASWTGAACSDNSGLILPLPLIRRWNYLYQM